MTIETENEAWVRSRLAAIAEPVRPRPDPYERLLRRRRLSWIYRGTGSAAAVVVVAVTSAMAATVVVAPARPEPTELRGWFRWIEELVDGPPRGALAADEPFRQELEQQVTTVVRSGEFHEDLLGIDSSLHPDQEVRLLFADDIDDRRIVVLALRLATPPDYPPYPAGPGRMKPLWLVGPRGASASSLASAVTSDPEPGVDSGSGSASPFVVAKVGEPSVSALIDSSDSAALDAANAAVTYVGLAPPGCTVLAAAATTPDSWVPEPTGSYIVRTPATYRAEFWRVTCDGVVRQEGHVPSPTNPSIPGELIEPALADLAAAGQSDDVLLRWGVNSAARSFAEVGPFVAGPAQLLYAGLASGLVIGDEQEHVETPRAVVVVAPRVSSTWFCFLGVSVGTTNAHEGTQAVVVLDADPLAPEATIAVGLTPRLANPQVVALLTSAAATAQLVAADDTVLMTASVADSFVVLTVPDAYVIDNVRAPDGLSVVAYDAIGSVVSTTPVIASPVRSVDGIGNWD